MSTPRKPQAKLTVPSAPQVVVPTGLESPDVTFEQPRPESPRVVEPLIQPAPPEVQWAKNLGRVTRTPLTKPVTYTSESSKWKHLAARYLKGNGVELATGGDPIVPTSIQFELSEASYAHYNSSQPIRGVVQWRDDNAVASLPFKDGVLDYVASSHLIEDFADWEPLLREWTRVLKVGGTLLICAPEKKRWAAYVAAGNPPNCQHRREPYLGEFSAEITRLKLPYSIVCERLTETPPGDHNIMACFLKL